MAAWRATSSAEARLSDLRFRGRVFDRIGQPGLVEAKLRLRNLQVAAVGNCTC
jgi:hypothetical protein